MQKEIVKSSQNYAKNISFLRSLKVESEIKLELARKTTSTSFYAQDSPCLTHSFSLAVCVGVSVAAASFASANPACLAVA